MLRVCLIIVGLINFLPVIGMFSAHNMETAYGISLADNNLIILMRHRALLFGVLGGFILSSAFITLYQGAAMIMAGVSMTGYVVLVLMVGGYNEEIIKVLFVDVFGVLFLLIAAMLKYTGKKPSQEK